MGGGRSKVDPGAGGGGGVTVTNPLVITVLGPMMVVEQSPSPSPQLEAVPTRSEGAPGPSLGVVSRARAISPDNREAPTAPPGRASAPHPATRAGLAEAGAPFAAAGGAAAAGVASADEYLMSIDRRQVRYLVITPMDRRQTRYLVITPMDRRQADRAAVVAVVVEGVSSSSSSRSS